MTPADEIATLQEEIRQLRALLRLDPQQAKIDTFARAFGLWPRLARTLCVLHDAGSAWVSLERLELAVPAHGDCRDITTLRVYVHHLRKKLPAGSIISHWGRGYTLGGPGILACEQALAAAGQRAAA